MFGAFKKAVKTALDRFGLLKAGEHLYFNIRTARPGVLRRELQYRLNGAPDGNPLPPPALIYDVIGCRWGDVFLTSGKSVVDDMAALLEKNRRPLSSFESILDFGCGCGRLIRQLPGRSGAALHGSDYNGELIGWCKENLQFARFTQNALAPPLSLEDESVDYIYARSVFTHLPENLQLQWMAELRRVLRKGGCLYFTMHGRPLSGGLTEQQRQLFDAGELVVIFSSRAGENLCSTYAGTGYMEKKLLNGFTLIDFVEGRDHPHLKQDIYLVQK